MTQYDAAVWHKLGVGPQTQAEELWARRALPEGDDRFLAALDVEGRRHLLIHLKPSDPDYQDTLSRGVSVVTRELVMHGHAPGRYLDIVCQEPAGHEAFDIIGEELGERLALGREAVTESVAHVLAKWRRFWGQLSQQHLSYEQQLGLFAELWFLSIWLIPKLGLIQAVKAWRGPLGARHDFEWPGRSVEVKATTSTRGPVHHINGIEQLAQPENGELLLFSLRLREEGGATNTLTTLVAACREFVKSNDEAWSHFESTLEQSGYLDAHAAEYAKVRYRVATEALYRVHEDFPRLTPDQITGGLPSGIGNISYELNLANCERYRIAESPSDKFQI